MIRAIIFDLDETLIDRDRTMRQFLAGQLERFPALSKREPHPFVEECLRYQANGYADKLQSYIQACSYVWGHTADLPAALFTDFKERYGFEAIAFDGAIDVVQALSSSYKVGVITNGRTRGQMAKIESSGLREYLSAIVISESHGEKKPAPSIFIECLRQLDSPPCESVFIGNNPSDDIDPAKALGMSTIWLRNDHFVPPTHCDAIASNIREIPSIIEKISLQLFTPSPPPRS